MLENRKHAEAIAELLEDHRGTNTVALYIGEVSSFTDYFVITTANSTGHLRGLMRSLTDYLHEHDIGTLNSLKRGDDTGWTLIDCGFAVVHIMTQELRDFYDLEHLWFHGETVYSSNSSSDS